MIYVSLGERRHAEEWIERAFEIDPDDNHVRYNAACVYARLGEFENAFDLLEVWVHRAARDAKLWFLNDPDFVSFRHHPRHPELRKKVGWG
jgi:adenylate cyclase